MEFVSIKDLSAFLAYGREHGCKMDGLEIVRSKDVDGNRVVGATMTLHFDTPVSHEKVIEEFGRLDGVQFIKEI